MSFAVASLSFLYFLFGSVDFQGQRLGVYPWADCTRIIQVAYGVKNTADGFGWSVAPLNFHWILFFPAFRQERSVCFRDALFFCTLSITLCTATNFGVCFFLILFPSTRVAITLLQTIFVLYFPPLFTTKYAHLALATVAPIR